MEARNGHSNEIEVVISATGSSGMRGSARELAPKLVRPHDLVL